MTPATVTTIPPSIGATATPTSGCAVGNYTVTAGTGTIVPGTTFLAGSNCDDCSIPLPIPFPFTFYGTAFNSVNVISNGNLQFSSTNTDFTNACEPYAIHSNVIHVYWDDYLMTTAGHGVYTSVSGIAPNRILNIEWRGCYYNLGSCGGPLNIEARLYETSGRIDVIYGAAANGNASATGGVQKDTGSLFMQAYCNGAGLPVSAGVRHTYTYLPGGGCATATPTGTWSTATRTATATITPTATSTVCPVQFNDVPISNTFYSSIRCLACRGIVSGYSDGTFRPNNQVTRGQLAKMVSNASGFSEPVSGQTFEDVPPTQTFYEWIERLSTRGYMSGYVCGGPGEPCTSGRPYFRPSANATRGRPRRSSLTRQALQNHRWDRPSRMYPPPIPSTRRYRGLPHAT